MPPRTNDFQRQILVLEQALAGDGATAAESVMVRNRSTKREREVDVVITQEIGGREWRMAVECRDTRRPQDTPWIEQLKSKYEHLGMHRVIAVSRSGFTDPAREYAYQVGIETMSFDEAKNTEWQSIFDDINFISMCRYRIHGSRSRTVLCFPRELGEHPQLIHDGDVANLLLIDGERKLICNLFQYTERVLYGQSVCDFMDMQDQIGVPIGIEAVHIFDSGEVVRDLSGATYPVAAAVIRADMVRLVTTGPVRHAAYDGARIALSSLESEGDRFSVVLVQRQESQARIGIVRLPPSQHRERSRKS
jgi:hypothetical protein